jgi:AcrR family transcriptional regulator
MSTPRKLSLKARAARQQETRRRITEAAVGLHESVGPARASISAIAREAGVQRLTLYRHFPDQGSLLQACSAHYMEAHPPPDASEWLSARNPAARVRRTLLGLYAYYRSTEAMTSKLLRDAEDVPLVAEMMQGYRAFVAMLAAALAEGWGTVEPDRVLRAALSHALDFKTWEELTARQGLSDAEAVSLMLGMVVAAGPSDAVDLSEV